MRLYDSFTDKIITMPELFNNWRKFSTEDKSNHSSSFQTELYSILLDSINGRNDAHIIGMTPAETERYILRLRSAIK